MERMMEKWMKKEKRNAEKWGSSIQFFDKGFERDGRKIMWEEQLYDLFQEVCKTSRYLYCYSCYPTGKLINYLDFDIGEEHYRFFFYNWDNLIQWNIVVYDGKGSYVDEYHRLSTEKLTELAVKVKKMVSLMEKIPKFRVKIALKEIQIEKENKFTQIVNGLEHKTEVH